MSLIKMESRSVIVLLLLLGVACVAEARKPVDSFNFQFDKGGEKHGFRCESRGKANWRAKGALGSAGCLKVTGAPAIVESEVTPFKTGESTLSFHYYSHGFNDMRLRLNVWPGPDREKFGSYSHNLIRKLPQDKWVFVQIKLKDLVGSATGKPKGYPELVFKRIAIFPINATKPGAYLLLDNIRLGPEIKETDIKVKKRGGGPKVLGHEKTTLLDFEDVSQVSKLRADKDTKLVAISVSKAGEKNGKGSAQLVCTKGKKWTVFELDSSILKGWEKYDFLSFDLHSEAAAFVPICVELWDDKTEGYSTRTTYGDQIGLNLPLIHKGKNTVLIDLRIARRNGKEGRGFSELGPQDRIGMENLRKVKIWFDTTKLGDDFVVHMDNMELLQEGALDSNMKISLPKGAIAFDFGEETPVVEGFTEANILDSWDGAAAFGFVDAEGLAVAGSSWPDPLTGDYVGPRQNPQGGDPMPADAGFDFRVRVPNGRYLVWVAAGYFPWPDRYVDLNINGELLFSFSMTPDRFYSKKGFFRFIDTIYSEKPNAVWNNYINKIYPARIMETEVTDGVFQIKGMNSFISALILLPIKQKSEFNALCKQIQAERIRFFNKDVFLVRPPSEPCRVMDKALVLFSPADQKNIMPWSGIDKQDTQKVSRAAALGETIAFPVALRPFADMKNAKFSLSNLVGPDGATISTQKAEILLKKYLSNGMTVAPWGLLPTKTINLEKDLTRVFWVRLRVPENTPDGIYKGTVTVSANDIQRTIPIEITVYPIRLADDIPLAIGHFYKAPDHGQFALFDRVKDFASQRDKILRQQMELMKDYGMTSLELPSPPIQNLIGSGVDVSFSPFSKVFYAARDAGMLANSKQRPITYMLMSARYIARKMGINGIGEEVKSKPWQSAYISLVQQLVDWSERNTANLVLWVVDEPRETPNPWNRTMADTIEHCKLVAKVPGAVRMVTPMGDVQSGKDYTPLADHVEIINTHTGVRSKKLIERGMTDKNLELWVYNVGGDRLSNGFYVWRVGATGKFEWHFNQWAGRARTGYPGVETHNPFSKQEGNAFTFAAPLKYRGALLPAEKLLTMSVGANDYRYIHTLNKAIARCKAKKIKLAKVAAATEYLKELRKTIPVLPKVKDLKQLDEVGKGVEANVNPEKARRKIAEFIVELEDK